MASAPGSPWDSFVRRVVIQTADYLDFDGQFVPGGRQRYIRDIAAVIGEAWGREVVVIQKARRGFETSCPEGVRVIGVPSGLSAYGDPAFAYKVSRMIERSDGVLYASGEDAWPFFRRGAKVIQHGVWWDGPQSRWVRFIQRKRALACVKAVRSVLCVDTNFINWLRCQGRLGLELCERCVYIPNYADLAKLAPRRVSDGKRLRLICARRFEEKRGTRLFLRALRLLKEDGFQFSALVCTIGGVHEIKAELRDIGLNEEVVVISENLEGVLKRYADADIAVVPSLWSEGTSLACVEAICAEVPVVATPVGGLGNLVIPGFNGLVVAPTAESMASAIKQFGDPSFLETQSSNCRKLRESLGLGVWRQRVLSWLRT